MPEIKSHAPGSFCWVDLPTTDAEAARRFYTPLFDWTATDVPAGEAGTYTMLDKGGKQVGALYELGAEMRKQGVPPHWQSYAAVRNADESAKKVKELGGKVIQPPFDVMDAGRMAVVQDPTGATFALWQPKQHLGAQLVNEPGSLCWNELYTRDTQAAVNFYTGLFAWTVKKSKSATGDEYTEFYNGDRPAGGMLEIKKEWGEVPPNWAVYFAVGDCDAALEKAKSLGGKVDMPPMEIQGVGRFALLQDPQGGHFFIIQMKGSVNGLRSA
jgi:predicted enzyme related to lactoylglutathione lyase